MNRPVRLTKYARFTIERAQDWYEAQRPGLGATFISSVDQAIGGIADHPSAYRKVVDDFRRATVPDFPYNIWFLLKPDHSLVVACVHQKRDRHLALRNALRPES